MHHHGRCLAHFSELAATSAVVNATLAAFKKRTNIHQDGETVTIVRVADHKTGLYGSTTLVIPQDDLSKLEVRQAKTQVEAAHFYYA